MISIDRKFAVGDSQLKGLSISRTVDQQYAYKDPSP